MALIPYKLECFLCNSAYFNRGAVYVFLMIKRVCVYKII
jgi:hypothetical protein